MTDERLSYRFGPVERRGILGGLRAGQAVAVGGGALVAIVVLDQQPTATGAFLGLAGLALSFAIAFAPVARHTPEEWAPIVTSFGLRRVTGRLVFRSRAPVAGMLATEQTGRAPEPGELATEHGQLATERGQLATEPGEPATERGKPLRRVLKHPPAEAPAALKGVRILEAPYDGRTIGVLAEQRRRRLTAVLACRVTGFSLLDPEAQERRLARWGMVLSGAAGGPVRRIQWLERTAPAQGDELARWLHDERDPGVPLRGTPMIESYLELIGATTRVAHEHEVLVAVQIDPGHRRGRLTNTGRNAGVDVLIEQAERVAQGLEAAEVSVLGSLGPGQLARTLRTAFDPYARAELAALEAADQRRSGLTEGNAWPLGSREHWDSYRSDGAWHATFWIADWPRVDVSPMFMDALLGRSSLVRTVAVTFEPVAPQRSTREAEAAVTRDHADRELRHRFGQAETARQRQAQDAALRREAELAAGHAEVRLAGFVTVSGRDRDELRRASSEIHEQAVRARLELRRMYGQQADAFAFTLPLCRGLR